MSQVYAYVSVCLHMCVCAYVQMCVHDSMLSDKIMLSTLPYSFGSVTGAGAS